MFVEPLVTILVSSIQSAQSKMQSQVSLVDGVRASRLESWQRSQRLWILSECVNISEHFEHTIAP